MSGGVLLGGVPWSGLWDLRLAFFHPEATESRRLSVPGRKAVIKAFIGGLDGVGVICSFKRACYFTYHLLSMIPSIMASFASGECISGQVYILNSMSPCLRGDLLVEATAAMSRWGSKQFARQNGGINR